jgi:uncharacterized protein (TIGR02246 family)
MDLLQKLDAENQIRNLQALYAQAADDADPDKFGGMFAEDGELLFLGDCTRGREKIGDWLIQSLATGRLRHLTMNSVVHVESESSAVGSLDLLVLHARDGQWAVMGTARYSDTYVRTPKGWKIKTREIIPMVPQP